MIKLEISNQIDTLSVQGSAGSLILFKLSLEFFIVQREMASILQNIYKTKVLICVNFLCPVQCIYTGTYMY